MADVLDPVAPLIAETGGINAMIVDSSALPEQAVRDIVASAFQSAGQRCSALRVLYVQEDVADIIEPMLFGAMDALRVGDPTDFATDVGPVIDDSAHQKISGYIKAAGAQVLKQVSAPEGRFIAPTALRVTGMADVREEIFGPVLHIARFKATKLDSIIDEINASGFGLTFGMHTRIDSRVQHAVARIKTGNMYINRNQIGAVVGSQPFGGEGLSGTGPKAGGPRYVPRFTLGGPIQEGTDMPGPTGESNRLSRHPRGCVLCLGPGADFAKEQAQEAFAQGCTAILADSAELDVITKQADIAAVAYWGPEARPIAQAIAQRNGAIIPLVLRAGQSEMYSFERHLCIDTTASGGNANLLANAAG